MKHLRQLCAASVLACLLSVSAYAGDISCGVNDPTPPPPPTITNEPTQQSAATDGTGDGVLETALMLLEGALSLF